jgi:thiol-disulfide isomerase/thioredoxin
MKSVVITVTAFIIFNFCGYAKSGILVPDSILNEASKALNRIKELRYENIRELNYPSEKYHYISSWASYYNFEKNNAITGFTYQVDDSVSKMIFNGVEKFDLDKKAKTIQINDHPAITDFNGISFLYNSIITLKNILPVLIRDARAIKTVKDTVIRDRSFFLIDINVGKRRIQNLGNGFDMMTTKYNFIYKIVLQKENYLPCEIIQANDGNNDFIKTIFSNIDTNPDTPAEISWYYSTYTHEYKDNLNKNSPQLIPVGSVAPDWKLEIYGTNKKLSLNELKGEVVLLDFWIKNCGPCIQSIPHLKELQNKLKGLKVKIVSINSYDSKNDVDWFCKKFGVDYTVLLNGKAIAEKYGVSGFPTFFIIDKTGKIFLSQFGYGESVQSEIEKAIKKLL